MHEQAFRFVEEAVAARGPFGRVVEIGSRDLNGSVRTLFGEARYLGLDVTDGPGVDAVFDPASPRVPDELADCVVCCEVLEHVEDWPSVLRHAAARLRGGGTLLLTAAGTGRRVHSGVDGRRRLHPGEHYANVYESDLERELLAAGFTDVEVTYVPHDVRAVARRRVRTVVEIPYMDHVELTAAVVSSVLADPATDLLVLDDNGSQDPATAEWRESLDDPRVRLRLHPSLEESGRSLYALWNEAVAAARALDRPCNLALLNNDVRLAPGTITALADALRAAPSEVAAVYPDWRLPLSHGVAPSGLTPTRGAWRRGGLSGFCFMTRAEMVGELFPAFDERYEWIFGDGDFVEGIELAGLTAARVEGLPLEHDKSTTARKLGWTHAAKRRDVARRKQKVAER